MEPGPPKVVERIVGWLLPPGTREHVVGDLRERCVSPMQYVRDAVRTVPMVIASQLKRSLDPSVRLLEAMLHYLAFLSAAWFLDPQLLASKWGLVKLAALAAVPFSMTVLGDIYWISPSVNAALVVIIFNVVPRLGGVRMSVAAYGYLGAGVLFAVFRRTVRPFAGKSMSPQTEIAWRNYLIAHRPQLNRKTVLMVLLTLGLIASAIYARF